MCSKGNRIITKTCEEGIIYEKVGNDLYMVGLIDNVAIRMTILKSCDFEVKTCSYGSSEGLCDFTSEHPSESLYACAKCELSALA